MPITRQLSIESENDKILRVCMVLFWRPRRHTALSAWVCASSFGRRPRSVSHMLLVNMDSPLVSLKGSCGSRNWIARIAFAVVAFASVACESPERTSSTDSNQPSSAPAPARVLFIDSSQSCRTCRLDVSRLATLVEPADRASWKGLPMVTRDGRGKYYALEAHGGASLVARFDASGRFEQYVGRKGPGPGEYRFAIGIAVGRDGSVSIQDSDRSIVSFDSSGGFIRETLMKFGAPLSGFDVQHPFARLSSGEYLMNAHIPTKELAGVPLFRATDAGELLSAFGPASAFAAFGTSINVRVMTLSDDEQSVWVAEPMNYLLEEVSLASKRVIRSVGVEAPWFDHRPFMNSADAQSYVSSAGVRRMRVRKEGEALPGRLEIAPATSLVDMRLDDRGRMWLLWRVPAQGWQRQSVRYRPNSEGQLEPELFDKLWVSYLDVLDIDSGRILARHRFDFAAHLIAPGVVGHSMHDDTGVKVDVLQTRLAVPE